MIRSRYRHGVRPDKATGGIVARYNAAGPKGYGLFLVEGKLATAARHRKHF